MACLHLQSGQKWKAAVWNWWVLKWIEQQIALLWNSVRADIRNNVSSQKEVNVFNSIDGWVYWKKIKTPNIEQWAFFSSFQYANSELTYDNFSKWLEWIKNWDRWMYLVPKRTVNAKWKEVRSVVPAEISWNVTVVPWILTNNNKENQKQKMAKAHDDRINEYVQAFNDYKNWDKKAITKVSSMLASDLAMHTQDDDFRRKVDIQKPSGAVFKWIVKQEVLNWEDYQIEWISPEVQWLLEKEWITLWEWRNEAIKNYYATMSDYEMELNALWEMNNSIINRLMEWDMSDDLKADLIDFVDAIYNIDNRISTPWEYDSMNQWPNAFDIYSSMSEIDEQTTCKL